MAHTTLDLSPRTTRRSDDDQNRAATFRRADVPGETASGDLRSTARRAAYRPREEVAIRRDVVEQFRNRLERDATHTPDNSDAVADALFGIARAEEALGRFEEARLALKRLDNVRDFSPVVWALSRRIHRQEGRDALANDTLIKARQSAEGALAVLLDLELARNAWLDGESADEIISRVDSLPDAGGDYTSHWKTRLHLDALLERGANEWALGVLGVDLEQIEDPELRDVLRMRAAIWSAVWGELSDATSLLEEVRSNGNLAGDLGEFLGSLYFELGERAKASELFETSKKLEQTDSVSAAMLQETVADSPKGADGMLESLIRREPEDWTALRVRETHLERYVDRDDLLDKAGESLIDVFNQQLEGPLSTQERVTKLTRLGRLYECEAGLEEAAAEVYREALALEADHVPALRALGRLYARRDNWAGLADLYEREIANMAGAPSVWRRHFQLAEIYRVRLENAVRALEHYRQVLEHRPHYLPALKAAAGLLGQLGRWGELADLFLASVEVAPNRRQKLYLLDKVAEVAENELQNYEVAIGAWQEILLLDEQHPRAFAALGRLYAKTGQWHQLIELNMRELELVEDAEEEAVLRQKCAEIAERHLEDLALAEKHYRAALDVLPDFLPALEGLGRIYMRKERWDDIIEMSGRELQETDDLREAIRRLGALAEIFETRLDRRDEAIRIYERILELDPSDAHAIESAIRLNYTLERWDQVVTLTERKLVATSEPRAFASLQGELGMIAEWHQNSLEQAYARYLAALDAEPANAHWLAGVSRCWSAAGQEADAVADRLEDNVMKPMPADVRDRYFKVIARLRERAHKSAEASRAYRMHGSSESLENQLVLQLAMAQGGEREVLQQFRRANPLHAIERLLDVNRSGLTVGDADAVREAIDALESVEREALLAELPVSVAAEFSRSEDAAELRLSAELVRVLEGEALKGQFDDSTTDPLSLRLRGIEARQSNDFDAYVFWTRRELELRESRDLRVSRLTEVAEFAAKRGQQEQTVTFLEEAARQAFPEMKIGDDEADEDEVALEDAIEGAQDGPTLDRLYQAIRAAERWELLRDCLEAHSLRDGLTRSRRLYLFRTLAEVLEQKLEDLEGASTALSHCWQLSEDVLYLRELVRVSMNRGELERAIRFQQRHFEHVTDADSTIRECVQSGLWLAELLLQEEERLEDGIDCLEHLLATYLDEQSDEFEEEAAELELFEQARRNLAYAYDQLGNAYRSVEYFQQVLGDQVDDGDLADWRQLVEVYSTRLDDGETAYELQWKIVESGKGGAVDLEMVVDLAFGADCLDDCAERLEELAEACEGERRRDLFARAAVVTEEDLMWPEEAVRLYTEAIECCPTEGGKHKASDRWTELVRRRAFCLSQIAGREHEALEEFRTLVVADPYEPTTYRGMSDLLERCQAFDRARISKQILRVLDCAVDIEEPRTKTNPTRLIEREQIEKYLLPEELSGGMIDVLQAAMPLVEKVWTDELPQRKALEGARLKKLDATDAKESLEAALDVFGITRFKAESGDSGPMTPQVFAGSSPYVWINWEQIEKMEAAELRFIAGYSAAIAWSGLPALLAVDGRRVWHLIEAVLLKQTGEGFDERVDMATQNLVDPVSSPFHAVARRRLMTALEPAVEQFGDVHCEIWPRAVEQFACRVGLVLSGDVRAAVRGLLSFHGWDLPLDAPETQKQIRRNEEVQRLMAFAMSDDYLEARYAFGLAGKPSKIVK